MDNLYIGKVTALNWSLNLISCTACTAFFYAFAKTPRKPIALKMIFLLIFASALASIIRLFAPYFTGETSACKATYSVLMFLFNFVLLWSTAMAILSALSLTKGLHILSPKFLKISLPIVITTDLLLVTIPTWALSELDITYLPGRDTCSLVLFNQPDQLSGKIALFFYSLLPGLTLLLVTIFCAIVVFVRLRARKAVIPFNFLTNISRVMWYPLGQLAIYMLALIACALSVFFQVRNEGLSIAQQILMSLAGFITCSIYAIQRLLVYNEERKLEGSEILSVSVSEKAGYKSESNTNDVLLYCPSASDY